MKSRTVSTTYAWLTLALITLVIVAVVGWVNLQLVNQLPQENEFQENWGITRDWIFRGVNPYDNPGRAPFTSPLPVVLFYSPFALLENYELARTAWITLNQIATVVFAILCIRVTYWQINRWSAGLFICLALFWVPAVSVFFRGTETALTSVLFAAAVFAIQKQNDEIAGILLGLAAMQPQVMLLAALLVLFWAGSHHRWALHFWSLVIFLLTSGIGIIFLPGWPLDFFWSTLRNVDFSIGKTIIDTTTRWWPGVGFQIGWGIIIFASIILIIEWWLARRKKPKRLVWVLAISFILLIWIGIEIKIDHVFLLAFSLATIFRAWDRRWGMPGQIFFIFLTIILLPGLWWAFIVFQQQSINADRNPILMIGFPFLTLIGLYWVRWWFLRATYLDEIHTINE